MRAAPALLITAIVFGQHARAQALGGAAPDVSVSAPRGQTIGGVAPLLGISPAELDSYGVDNLSDLVEALRPITRSSRSDQLAVILINGHLAGQTEFDNLPREAVERVEVLPEIVALQYGFSENQRVLNFILREHYRAVPVRFSDSGATEGGSQALAADASLARLEEEARITMFANYRESAWLRESDRGIDLPDSYYRTLQPEKTDAKIAGTLSRSILGFSTSVEASFEAASARSLQGLAEDTGPPAALVQSAPQRTGRIAAQLTGQAGSFVWGATAYGLHQTTHYSSETGADAGGVAVDRTQSAFDAANLQLSLSGPAARLPAGPIMTNFKFGLQYQGFDTRNEYPGSIPLASNLVRSIRSVSLNANLPIANASLGVLPRLNALSATFSAAIDDVSQFGTLLSESLGFEWTPTEKFHIDGIFTDHRAAPTVQQLRAPPVFTSNFELFDFVASQTAYVTQISGGNPNLSGTDAETLSVGLSLGPILGKTSFSARFEQGRVRNAIGALPPITADVQLAFPERFVRSAGGSLLEVDDRWVNLQATHTDDLKWGFNYWLPLGSAAAGGMGNRIETSLFDTWYLHDTTLIRTGVPLLDLLDGAPSDVAGGQPRHKIEFRTLVYTRGVGGLVSAAWRSATSVDSGDSAALPDSIRFSSLATADLRVFADFERVPWANAYAWAKGARISAAVTNLLDRRQSVHDEAGTTPAAFAPGYLDPPGRMLAFTIRKIF